MLRGGLAAVQGGSDEVEALVECEPGRTGMPREHVGLLDGGVEAVSDMLSGRRERNHPVERFTRRALMSQIGPVLWGP